MINYQIAPSQQVVLYLNGYEERLRKFIAEHLREEKYQHLGLELALSLGEGERSYSLEGNHSFGISHSMDFLQLVQNYLERSQTELDAVLGNKQSLQVSLRFRERAQESKKPDQEGLPNFLPVEPRYTLDQLIIPAELRQELLEAMQVIDNQELIYRTWGFEEVDPIPKSVLNFYGPPGTGKTMCAHAIAALQGKKLLALNYAEIESKYVGDAPKNLMHAFETAKRLDCVLFFDEADSFLGKRIQNVQQGADQALNSLRSQMLILLEEFSGTTIFATNLVTNFDAAFESRILKHLKFDLPSKEARIEILKKMIPKRLPLASALTEEEWVQLGELSEGLAGRELKAVMLETLLAKASTSGTEAVFVFEDFKLGVEKKQEACKRLREEKQAERKAKILKALANSQSQEEEEPAQETSPVEQAPEASKE